MTIAAYIQIAFVNSLISFKVVGRLARPLFRSFLANMRAAEAPRFNKTTGAWLMPVSELNLAHHVAIGMKQDDIPVRINSSFWAIPGANDLFFPQAYQTPTRPTQEAWTNRQRTSVERRQERQVDSGLPRFRHNHPDCCQFAGRSVDTDHNNQAVDLYWCEGEAIIARYGNGPRQRRVLCPDEVAIVRSDRPRPTRPHFVV